MLQSPWLKTYETLGVETVSPLDLTLADYLGTHARVSPESPALYYFGRSWTYEQANAEVNKIANALKAAGIPNLPQYYFSLMAISKLGAIGSGVSPRLAPPELAYQIQNARIKVLMGLGEIGSAGPQLMKDSLGLPEESARALRVIEGERWMFTGDVGYMDEERYVFLCDRAKDMLIVGGFKVFYVEVEDKLSGLPMVAGSAVIGTPDKKRLGNDIVNLYIALSPEYRGHDEKGVREQILTWIRENIAAYKVPKTITFIDAIPLTPVGKIDKKKLCANAIAA